MTRAMLTGALICTAALLRTSSPAAQELPLDRVAQSLSASIISAGGTRIAVTDFTDLQGRTTELGRLLAEELSVAFVNAPGRIRVIDRAHLRTLLEEHELASTGLIDQRLTAELGKIAGVDILVTATVTELGNAVRVNIKALLTETADVVAAQNVSITQTGDLIGLFRRDVVSTSARSSASSTPRESIASNPRARAFQNDFLIVTLDSVAVSEEQGASLGLSFENKTGADQLVLCQNTSRSRPTLIDDRANRWRFGELGGINTTSWEAGSTNIDAEDFTRIPPGTEFPVILGFTYRGPRGGFTMSRQVTFSMTCLRLFGQRHSQFAIGISGIVVGE